MFEKLMALLENSYSPYSHFRVSSIVVMKDGKEFSGVNIENASYGATIFEKIYVLCDSQQIQPSCFVCRQVMSEMFEKDKEVVWFSNTGESVTYRICDLCPYPFGSQCLE